MLSIIIPFSFYLLHSGITVFDTLNFNFIWLSISSIRKLLYKLDNTRAHRAHTPRAMVHCECLGSIEHAQNSLVQAYAVVSIGVATMGNKKAPFVTRIPRFEAHWSQFFARFDWFAVLTSRSGA
jgi:hypothetical protein